LLCAAQAAQDTGDLDRRLGLAEVERSHGHLAAAESMLAGLQAEIERTEAPGLRLLVALREQGLLRDDEGRPQEAIPFYERALAIVRARPEAKPVTIGALLANLASSYADCGDGGRALALATESMTILAGVDRTNPEFTLALYAHGVALRRLGRSTEALRDLREALAIWRQSVEPNFAPVSLIQEGIVACLIDLGFFNQAEATEREALALREKSLEPDSPAVASSLNNLGVILAREQRFSEGRPLLERSARILEQFGEKEQQRLATVLGNLGGLLLAQARNSAPLYAKAEEVYRHKLAIEERLFPPGDVRVAQTLETLGEILYSEHAYQEAGQTYGRGLAIQQAAYGPSDPQTQAAAKRYNTLVKKMK